MEVGLVGFDVGLDEGFKLGFGRGGRQVRPVTFDERAFQLGAEVVAHGQRAQGDVGVIARGEDLAHRGGVANGHGAAA